MEPTGQQAGAGSGLARALMDRVARALPADQEETRQGWRLRHTDTSMWWVGAALAHNGRDTQPHQARIRAAEEFYAARGALARFQVCPGCPPGLDTVLARHGYHMHAAMSLQTAATAQVADRLGVPRLQLHLTDQPGAAWFEIWQAVHAPDAALEPERRLLRRIRPASAYVTVHAGGRPVAVGRAVIDSGWAGVFGMATLPHARGQGAGTAVLAALARWAVDRRTPRIYLQLDHDNRAAQQLYASADFTELFTYHYRTRPTRLARCQP